MNTEPPAPRPAEPAPGTGPDSPPSEHTGEGSQSALAQLRRHERSRAELSDGPSARSERRG